MRNIYGTENIVNFEVLKVKIMSKQSLLLTAIYVATFAVLDVLCTTAFYTHGFTNWSKYFIEEVRFFNIRSSFFELWVFVVVRFIMYAGAIIGMLMNVEDAVKRIQNLSLLMFAIGASMWSYTIVKLLLYSETNTDWQHDVWFWCLFSWSIFASIMFYINWAAVLTHLKPDKTDETTSQSDRPERRKRVRINTNDDEQDLLSDDEENTADTDDDKEKKPTKNAATVGRLLRLSKPDLPYILVAFFFLLVACAAETFIPLYTGNVIQGIAIERNQHKFTIAIIYLSLFSLASAIGSGMRAWFFKIAMSRLNIRIRKELFASIVNQEVGFFDTVKTGEISSRLQSDTTIMSESLGLNVNIFLRNLITGLESLLILVKPKVFLGAFGSVVLVNLLWRVGVVIFMVKLSWRLSMVTLIGVPVITCFSSVYGNYYQKLAEQEQDALAKSNEVAEETCSSMRTVRSFASERQEAQRYSDRMADVFKLNIKEAFVYAGYLWSNNLFALSLGVATLYYGGMLVIHHSMTGGALVSFILYQEQLSNCIEQIGYVYTGLMQAVGASSKVFEYIDRKPKLEQSGKLAPAQLRGRLEFRNVTFAYPSRPASTVLKNVNFCVEPGEVVALVGPSGGGKSSCVNLLEHFYETKGGQVLLDNKPIQSYDHKYLHQQIALVGQEPVLFARTIKENISYGMDNCDMEQIEQAARMANAHQFIVDMKEKYETQTGEKGVQLSGGQKQRIAIARAIIRNPAVLLLDEATSALDSESEHLVQQALYQNLKNRTVLIIAHRLSTVENASRIVVIDKGRVVETGTHIELLANNSLYSQLVKRQLLGGDSALGVNSPSINRASSNSSPYRSSSMDINRRPRSNNVTPCGSLKSLGTPV